MPNASDPYGSYAYQERIVRENKFFISTMRSNQALGLTAPSPYYINHSNGTASSASPNRSLGNTVNSPLGGLKSPMSNSALNSRASSRVGTPCGGNASPKQEDFRVGLNTLSGELHLYSDGPSLSPRRSARGTGTYSPNRRSPTSNQYVNRPVPIFHVPTRTGSRLQPSESQANPTMPEGEACTEKTLVSSKLQQLESMLEERVSEKKSAPKPRKESTAAPTSVAARAPNLPAIPTFRSPRRMPHNIY